MACKCIHIANTYVVNDDSTNVVLQFSNTVTASNKDRFCFKTVTALPSANATYSLYATVNGNSVPVLNKYGNPMLVSDVKVNRMYKGWYGAESTAHIIASNTPLTCNTGCGNEL